MRKKFSIDVEIPEGINCSLESEILKCKKGEIELSRKLEIRGTDVTLYENKISFNCNKANKKNIAIIKSYASHVKNMLNGLGEKFVYRLEICNVHFPMTVKVDGNNVIVSNFLGEKIGRKSKILDGVKVEVKGKDIKVSGSDLEKTGQTAANLELATKVPKKDRRIFQDGCFIVEKPGGKI